MTDERGWLDRVLSFEELPPGERAEVDAILAANPEARRLLELVQQAERAEPEGVLPEDAALAVEDVAGARRSLEELLRRALPAGAAVVGPKRRARRAWFTPRLLVPAALAALVVVWLMLPDSPFAPAVLDHFGAFPDGVRGVEAGRTSGWHDGDAFTLRAELREPSLVVLVHVDPRGRIEVLAPDPDETITAQRAGTLAYPPANERWTLEGGPGVETFLLAARRDVADTTAVSAAAADVARMGAGADAVARVRAYLAKRFDVVRITRIRHGAAGSP